MIVSASYRTDIPAFYGAWFLNRLDAGYCRVANPYGGKPGRVSLLREDVEGFVFWTKNAGPFLPALEDVSRRGFPFMVQYTINGYPTAIEASVPDCERSCEHARAIAGAYGGDAVVWRYDPLLVTGTMTADWHRANFARLAARLEGATDEVVMSFAQFYAKTKRNIAAAAKRHDFACTDPGPDEKRALAAELAEIAAAHGMKLNLCTQPGMVAGAAGEARCIDAARLSKIAGRAISAPEQGNRPGCACHLSRDIGAYDTCPMGCVYCYAVRTRALARERHRGHDAHGEFLFPPAQPAAIRGAEEAGGEKIACDAG